MSDDEDTSLLLAPQPIGLAPSVVDRREEAAGPRTLIDILQATAGRNPESAAIEDPAGTISYSELLTEVETAATALGVSGVRRGDRVGVRLPSGSRGLYLAILSVLAAGAAYVPVDADDPKERADLVFAEAGVVGVLTTDGYRPTDHVASPSPATAPGAPTPGDEAWIIFTSGSTGLPKGVAVSHRSAAAFVDAEAGLFLRMAPLGPGDRVLAGLSVGFDASCEEMWLAWRYGACLVPAPRSVVRSGEDLGGWLVRHRITIVSTVPTLAALWPVEALEQVRLLIFGGEACPPDLVARLIADGREVWNTYGPTEATVVTTAALLDGRSPVSIGLPLPGWAIAVVDRNGEPVPPGVVGELVIGGVGLARYLDAAKDADRYAPLRSLGWERAYRSGDLVSMDSAGLLFQGRADDQVKVGGRRIELGEVEAAIAALAGVDAAAVAVRSTEGGVPILVGYLVADSTFDRRAARATLAKRLPAPMIPMLALVDQLPARTSGKVDRDALPWPLPEITEALTLFQGEEGWLAQQWLAVLGTPVIDRKADFFDIGGGSLAAAQLVSRIRARAPEFSVADVYDHPRLEAMATAIAETAADTKWRESFSKPRPTPLATRWAQTLLGVPLFIFSGARWLVCLLTASWVLRLRPGFEFLPQVNGWVLLLGLLLFAAPFGRMAIAAASARLLLAGLRPGDYPRGGQVHMRLWLAEQIAHQVDSVGLAGAPWVVFYARALGARIGRDVDLHTLPPVTGLLRIGDGAAIEPEVDLAGYWIDGDIVRIGGIRIGAQATVGARSTLAPGTRIDPGAEVAPGSAVFGGVKSGQLWAGSPAVRAAEPSSEWPSERPPGNRTWLAAYGVSSVAFGLLPILAISIGAAVVAQGMRGSPDVAAAGIRALPWLVPGVLVAGVTLAGAIIVSVRLLAIGLEPGIYPVRSRVGWQAWCTERLLDSARALLFPIYASLITPLWLRLLGAEVGKDVEASTVMLLPSVTVIGDGAFLADDTMVASYDLHNGWLRIGRVTIGKRAFLGNSGLAGAGHSVPRDGLVAVLSVAPVNAKPGSSWLGSPPVRLRRMTVAGALERTYRPTMALRWSRAAWEACRMLAVVTTCGIGLYVVLTLAWLDERLGLFWTVMLSGIVMLAAGAVAAAISTAVKWVVVGTIRSGEHPLWSSFVWRTEVFDAFIEMVAGPWFANANVGTPALALWLRTLGARIGRGVWCDTYWLPEPDLVTLGDGATVNRGCVLQTHLFHDRIMSMDGVTIERGGTLGPHSIVLPGATIGANATIGPASLVMRGESVPVGSRWSGNPIGPWRAVKLRAYQAHAS